jgi:hypothetical protein
VAGLRLSPVQPVPGRDPKFYYGDYIMRIRSAYKHNFLALLALIFSAGNADSSIVFLPDLLQAGIVDINNGVATLQTGNNDPAAVDTGIFTDPVNGNTLGLRGSTLTGYTDLPTGTSISFTYEFVSTNPPVFNDFAIILFEGENTSQNARLIADSYTVPPSGDTGLQTFSYVLPANYDSFTIVVSNSFASADNATLQIQDLNIVPVPPQWLMFVLSCAIFGSWSRKNLLNRCTAVI